MDGQDKQAQDFHPGEKTEQKNFSINFLYFTFSSVLDYTHRMWLITQRDHDCLTQ